MEAISKIESDDLKSASFHQLVIDRQQRWKAEKQNPIKTFSQAIDLPEGTAGEWFNTIVDYLPDYIPDHVKEDIRLSHPNPTIGVSLLVDKRLLNPPEELIPEFLYPATVLSSDKDKWKRGIILLDEIAADTLTFDILDKIQSSSKGGTVKKIFLPLLLSMKKELTNRPYKADIGPIEKLFNGKEAFTKFRQSLAEAMLTADPTKVNQSIAAMGYSDIDALAIKMGEQSEYLYVGGKLMARLFGERIAWLGAGGMMSTAYPGVINILPMHTLAGGVSAFATVLGTKTLMDLDKIKNPVDALLLLGLTGLEAYLTYNLNPLGSIPCEILHEIVHYLGSSMTHAGLRKVAYKK